MSATIKTIPIGDENLVEIPCPHVEPRIVYQSNEPRKVNNLR